MPNPYQKGIVSSMAKGYSLKLMWHIKSGQRDEEKSWQASSLCVAWEIIPSELLSASQLTDFQA